MRISIKAKPAAKEDAIAMIDDFSYAVSVKEPPIQGRANKGIVKILSEYFSVPQSSVRIISGFTSKNKVVEILK